MYYCYPTFTSTSWWLQLLVTCSTSLFSNTFPHFEDQSEKLLLATLPHKGSLKNVVVVSLYSTKARFTLIRRCTNLKGPTRTFRITLILYFHLAVQYMQFLSFPRSQVQVLSNLERRFFFQHLRIFRNAGCVLTNLFRFKLYFCRAPLNFNLVWPPFSLGCSLFSC